MIRATAARYGVQLTRAPRSAAQQARRLGAAVHLDIRAFRKIAGATQSSAERDDVTAEVRASGVLPLVDLYGEVQSAVGW